MTSETLTSPGCMKAVNRAQDSMLRMVEWKGENNLGPWWHHWATELTCSRAIMSSEFSLSKIMYFVDSTLHFLFIVQHLWNQNVFCHDNILQSLLARGGPDIVVIACACVNLIIIPSDILTAAAPWQFSQQTTEGCSSQGSCSLSECLPLTSSGNIKASIITETSIMSISAWKKFQEAIVE